MSENIGETSNHSIGTTVEKVAASQNKDEQKAKQPKAGASSSNVEKHRFKCPDCKFVGATKWLLTRHTRAKHDPSSKIFKCDKCSFTTSDKWQLTRHLKTHDKKELICEDCSFTTKSRKAYDQHMKTQHKYGHSSKMLTCPICTRLFVNQKELDAHVLAQHPDARTAFTCSECDEDFETENLLLEHIDDVHSIVTHQCHRCSLRLQTVSDLERHVECTHSEGTGGPFRCEVCEMCFKYKMYLMKHIALKHRKP